MKNNFSYSRKEKLKSRKLADEVFTKGKFISVAPLKAFFICPAELPDNKVKAGVSVSSRNFKKAADRNRIKRLMREAYRKNKNTIYDVCDDRKKCIAVFFLFTGREIPDYYLVETKMKTLLKKLSNELASQNT